MNVPAFHNMLTAFYSKKTVSLWFCLKDRTKNICKEAFSASFVVLNSQERLGLPGKAGAAPGLHRVTCECAALLLQNWDKLKRTELAKSGT